jgi:glycolate oxidase FAD binding subunit
LTDFPAGDTTAVVLKANVVPSQVCNFVALLESIDPGCSVQAHAGNGIVLARMSLSSPSELSQLIVKKLQPSARNAGGSMTVVAGTEGVEPTRQVIWGGASDDLHMMQAVKQQFDPLNLLNPGRFVYGAL